MKKRLIWTLSIIVGLLALLVIFASTVSFTPDSYITVQAVDHPPAPAPARSDDFWSAMSGHDFGYSGADREDHSENDLFATAASLLTHGDLDRAAKVARQLSISAADSVIRLYAGDILYSSLIGLGEWTRYLDAIPSLEEMAAGDSSARRCPDERLLAEGWQKPPRETWSWGSDQMVLPLKPNRVGHAMVEVEINGVPRWFVIDTGASMSVISSGLAAEIGIDPLHDLVAQAGTSNSFTVAVRPASIQTMQIGDLTIHNHRVIYIASESLEFKLWKFTLFKIEGILGWNAIRQMRLELDYENGVVVIERPETAPATANPDPNFIWAGESNPLVRLLAEDGTPLWFFLDTGANQTQLYRRIYDKLDLTVKGQRRSASGGAGGFEMEMNDQVDDFSLYLHNYRFDFPTILVKPEQVSTTRYGMPEIWFDVDGIIGFDLAGQGKMIIDLPGGRFEVHPPGS